MEHSESTKSQHPNKISSRHRALMRRLVAGMTLSQACEDVGYSLVRASVVVNSPLFKEEKEKMEKEVKKGFVNAEAGKLAADPTRLELDNAKTLAAKTLKGALSDQSGNVRVNAAKDILDRTGYKSEDKLRANVLVEPSKGLLDMLTRVMSGKNGSNNASGNTEGKDSPAK